MNLSNIQVTEAMQNFLASSTVSERTRIDEFIKNRLGAMANVDAKIGEVQKNHYMVPSGTITITYTTGDILDWIKIDYTEDTTFDEVLQSLQTAFESLQTFHAKLKNTTRDNRELIFENFNQLVEEFGDARGMLLHNGDYGIFDIIDLLQNLHIMIAQKREEATERNRKRAETLFIARTDEEKKKRSEELRA